MQKIIIKMFGYITIMLYICTVLIITWCKFTKNIAHNNNFKQKFNENGI